MNRIALIFIGFLMMACTSEPPLQTPFENSRGESMQLENTLAGNKGAVLLFLSPECPLCQNYSVAINELRKYYSPQAMPFIGIISGEFYSVEEVIEYKVKYDLDMDFLFDPDFKISEYYQATTTPEAVLINKEGKLMYKGAIDNWAISLGKKRIEATEHYLKDGLISFLSGKEIAIKKTKPVGCYIE